METYQEKISLLQEMIAFALIDGELHDREYDFLEIVAQELEIDKTTFLGKLHFLFKYDNLFSHLLYKLFFIWRKIILFILGKNSKI